MVENIELVSGDWLNKKPIFYNLSTNRYSENINEVIDFHHFEWDYDGLKNYLDFGYCIFGRTPVKNVQYTLANEKLIETRNGLEIKKTNDPFLVALKKQKTTHPDDIHQWMSIYLQNHINPDDTICLPLSGGYDSRYLGAMIRELDYYNVKAYTFGISRNQKDSFEVVRAYEVAKQLGLNWKQIHLKNVFDYVDKWYELFGVSTHLHGHHQLYFYDHIVKSNGKANFCLSGLVGDAWTGKIELREEIESPHDIIKLGLNHGISASSKFLRKNTQSSESAEVYFEENRDMLRIPEYRIVSAIRLKMMLLRYLEVLPNVLGMKTISPFTDLDFVVKSLKLESHQREHRKWQEDFFRKRNLMPEDQTLKESCRWEAQEYYFLREAKKPLNNDLLREIYQPERVKWVNKHICNTFMDSVNLRLNLPFRGRRFFLPIIPKSEHKAAFSEYYTLWPLQKLIERRNAYLNQKKIEEV